MVHSIAASGDSSRNLFVHPFRGEGVDEAEPGESPLSSSPSIAIFFVACGESAGENLGPGRASAEQFGFQADKLTDSTANRTRR